jgi:hypothetical protein
MLSHIHITIKATGDAITAISQTLKIAIALDETMYLYFDGFSIAVQPKSNIQDLITIFRLESEIKQSTKQ